MIDTPLSPRFEAGRLGNSRKHIALKYETLPVLPSLNLDETFSFYRDQLGFASLDNYQDEKYLIVARPDIELHFWRCDDKSLCENTSVYIRGDAIDALHAEFKSRNVERMTDLAVRPWGMEEFYVHDPHGNLLRFGREHGPKQN